MELENTYFRDVSFPLPELSQEDEDHRFERSWDPDDSRIKQFIQPELVAHIPHGRGGSSRRKRRTERRRILPHRDVTFVSNAQELNDITLNRFHIRLSPGEHYFYSIRPWYAEKIIRAYLTIIGITGITESRDRFRRYTIDMVRRTRDYILYLTREERLDIGICRGGAVRMLAAHARREDAEGVAGRDFAAQRKGLE